MHGNLDFGSRQGVLSTLLGLVVVPIVAIGIRLLLVHGVQQRRERQNRQINERRHRPQHHSRCRTPGLTPRAAGGR